MQQSLVAEHERRQVVEISLVEGYPDGARGIPGDGAGIAAAGAGSGPKEPGGRGGDDAPGTDFTADRAAEGILPGGVELVMGPLEVAGSGPKDRAIDEPGLGVGGHSYLD